MRMSCNTLALCLLIAATAVASQSENVLEPSTLATHSGCTLQDGDSTCHLGLVQGKAEALRHARQMTKGKDAAVDEQDDEEEDAQLDETKDEEEDDKEEQGELPLIEEEEEEDEEDEEQVLKRREQLLAKKLTAVEPYDCKNLNRPVQVLRENEAGSVFAVKTLGIKKGTYKTLYTIPYERTSPPFDDINSCAISPVSDIVYCAITLDGGNDYMARIDGTQIEFVAKLPNADSKYIAAAFSKKGNFHFSEGKGNSVYLGTISGVDDLPGFPDQNDPALGDYTDTPRSKVIKVADWVAFMADIKGNKKKGEWLLGIMRGGEEAVLVDGKTKKVYRLQTVGIDSKGGAFGAGWNFKGRIFFASNNGDGVYEVGVNSIDLKNKQVVLEKVGLSTATNFNDGLNCLNKKAPGKWNSCISKSKKACKNEDECELVRVKKKKFQVDVCLMTTTTTTTTLGECTIYGDPHIVGFDRTTVPVSLIALESASEKAIDSSKIGDFWLVRSSLVHVQGRYNSVNGQKMFLRALALGGPFLQNNTFLIGVRNNKVLWNNEEILTSLPSHFENQLISASRYKNAMLVQDPFRQGQAPGLDVHFPLNMNLHMTEGENGLGVRITMPPAPGGQDGLCGNFNGVGDDDTSELVSKRPGARIAAEELLFRNSFVLPHIQ